MSSDEKLEKLRIILKEQIQFYDDNTDDEDRIYDDLYDTFNNLTRSDFMKIIQLVKKERE